MHGLSLWLIETGNIPYIKLLPLWPCDAKWHYRPLPWWLWKMACPLFGSKPLQKLTYCLFYPRNKLSAVKIESKQHCFWQRKSYWNSRPQDVDHFVYAWLCLSRTWFSLFIVNCALIVSCHRAIGRDYGSIIQNCLPMNNSNQPSMVFCQKSPTRHAYAWQIGPFWQDTLVMSWAKCIIHRVN